MSKSFDRAGELEEIVAAHVLTHAGHAIKANPETVDAKRGTKALFEDSLGLFRKVLDRLQ